MTDELDRVRRAGVEIRHAEDIAFAEHIKRSGARLAYRFRGVGHRLRRAVRRTSRAIAEFSAAVRELPEG